MDRSRRGLPRAAGWLTNRILATQVQLSLGLTDLYFGLSTWVVRSVNFGADTSEIASRKQTGQEADYLGPGLLAGARLSVNPEADLNPVPFEAYVGRRTRQCAPANVRGLNVFVPRNSKSVPQE